MIELNAPFDVDARNAGIGWKESRTGRFWTDSDGKRWPIYRAVSITTHVINFLSSTIGFPANAKVDGHIAVTHCHFSKDGSRPLVANGDELLARCATGTGNATLELRCPNGSGNPVVIGYTSVTVVEYCKNTD
jgi:hypothetical protein